MEHQATALAPTDPLVGHLYTTQEVAQLLRVRPADRAGLEPLRDADSRALRQALTGAPGRSGDVWRGPAPAPPTNRDAVRRRETGTMGAAEYRVLRIW
jgi:hypothetical protein